ncbi:acyl carrier protein [Streptomyces sp. HNM0663]|uniref:Acyl carrier protein n=1 Tax=Streptomyces chengmaiensis TaxID=3040919 RepID=A0ABT6HH40_9ACTN|nr:acyl carrier protein [Streptomyces chengmaiensis]MDH2387905.1 acyl carrier protein [Streptomyces chengmaiensis]
MTRDEALEIVKDEIRRIVPDADFDAVPPDAPFREVLDMDSLDFLAFVSALGERTGLALPEEDYPALGTLSGCAGYLAAGTGQG